jgi:hypothetical protein
LNSTEAKGNDIYTPSNVAFNATYVAFIATCVKKSVFQGNVSHLTNMHRSSAFK